MKDNLRIDKEYQEFFLLDEAKLRKIVEIIQTHAKRKNEQHTELVFEVFHKDNSKYQTDKLENVLNDENITGREIGSLNVLLTEKEEPYSYRDPMCSVKFQAREYNSKYVFDSKSITYKIDDSDKAWAYSLSEELDLYIKRTLKSNKKSILKAIEWIDDIFPIIIFCIALLLLFNQCPQLNMKLGDLTLSTTIIGLPILIIIIIALYGLYGIFEPFTKLSAILQGKSVFYIGDQKDKYDKRIKMINNITWVVIVGFLVSFIAGLIIAMSIK